MRRRRPVPVMLIMIWWRDCDYHVSSILCIGASEHPTYTTLLASYRHPHGFGAPENEIMFWSDMISIRLILSSYSLETIPDFAWFEICLGLCSNVWIHSTWNEIDEARYRLNCSWSIWLILSRDDFSQLCRGETWLDGWQYLMNTLSQGFGSLLETGPELNNLPNLLIID